ncbi:hypothetical protein [Methanobrevibacter woesei]|nr:hypothetical protein [Methanobrevibacter woesei]
MIELRKDCIGIGENEKLIKGDLFKLDWCSELDTTLPTLNDSFWSVPILP